MSRYRDDAETTLRVPFPDCGSSDRTVESATQGRAGHKTTFGQQISKLDNTGAGQFTDRSICGNVHPELHEKLQLNIHCRHDILKFTVHKLTEWVNDYSWTMTFHPTQFSWSFQRQPITQLIQTSRVDQSASYFLGNSSSKQHIYYPAMLSTHLSRPRAPVTCIARYTEQITCTHGMEAELKSHVPMTSSPIRYACLKRQNSATFPYEFVMLYRPGSTQQHIAPTVM